MSEPAQQGTDTLDNVTKFLQQAQSVSGSGNPTGDLVGSLLGGMSTTVIVINVIAGLIGAYYFMYGKRVQNIPMMICGGVLCIVPYFISNVYGLAAFCLLLAAAPFLVDRFDLFS